MNKPKVSVIIPAHNAQAYIEKCLNSLINQTLKDIEIVVANDSSTDKTEEILKHYASIDSRIKFITVNKKSSGGARNEGLKLAQGEYIGFVDSDDWIDLDYFEKLYNKSKEDYVDVIATNSVWIIKDGVKDSLKDTGCKSPFVFETLEEKTPVIVATGVVWNKIYKREFILKNDFKFPEENTQMDDNYFTIHALIAANKIVFINDTSYYYNWIETAQTKRKKGFKDFALILLYKKILKEYEGCELETSIIKKRIVVNSKSFFHELPQSKRKLFLAYIKINFPWADLKLKKKRPSFLKRFFSIETTYSKFKRTKIYYILGLKIAAKARLNKKQKAKFADYVLSNPFDKTKFVKIKDNNYQRTESDTKLISFYLPQYHEFEENIKWFGHGFSEWTNTTKTTPQFIGHNQPQLPVDVGFYNLETTDIMKRQIELAKTHGIYGFSFYYYWFSGKKVMEKPVEAFLKDKTLDMPFFLFWANEPWTKLWGDGNSKEVLFQHEILEGDAKRFMDDVLPYMKDERYIKIEGRPILVIYKPEIYEGDTTKNFVQNIRQIAKEEGFPDLYIMTARKTEFDKDNLQGVLDKYSFDSMFEFFPCGYYLGEMPFRDEEIANEKFLGNVFDVEKYVNEEKYIYDPKCKMFKGVFPSWDNTARKCQTGCTIYQQSPESYKKWLKGAINWTKEHNKEEEQIVFINAWNEWAEGAHLEPDQKFGYAYLEATKEALVETRSEKLNREVLKK